MRSSDSRQRGFVCRVVPALVSLVLLLGGCADGFAPLTAALAPQELVATSLRPGVVQLRWNPVTATTGSVVSYIVERRVAIDGAFTEIARVVATTRDEPLAWIDTDVMPGTIYGYRVRALTDLGDRSAPSVVGGVVTPPPPGIEIVTLSTSTTAEALDPDGYQVSIMGPDTIRASLGNADRRRFSPLRAGAYTVRLTGIVARCAASDSVQQATVVDTAVVTITPLRFNVACKDPNRGELQVTTTLSGGDLDPEWSIDVLGQAADSTLPVADRVFSRTTPQTAGAPSTTIGNLFPGTYNVTLRGLAANCTLTGSAQRTATVTKLGLAGVTFEVSCLGAAPPPPPPGSAPFVWRSTWNPKSATTGATVVLEQTLDLSAKSGQRVAVVQGLLRFDPAVLRYEEAEAGQLGDPTVGANTPGALSYTTGVTGAGRAGVVNLAKFRFTVIGAAGAKSPVSTTVVVASANSIPFKDSVRVVGDTFTVGTGGVVANRPPVAQFTGPTSGTVGTALAFTGSGSTDPDGTIAAYAWSFGDNTTSTVASPSKTYTVAGTYTVLLTVTDNAGATASRSASITVSAAGTPPPTGTAPVARANGPYTVQAGTALALSSVGSANATLYSWSLGNGQTVTGASPSVIYAAAGTYTVVLTITSAAGATATSQATVTVSAAPPPSNVAPLIWRNVVQAYDLANNSIALQIVYDMNANLGETPGPEALRSFVVDSLKWDTARLQFLSLNYGPGMVDVATNQVGASSGRLVLRGSTTPGLDQGNLVIATIRFRPVGTAGQSATTATFLGPLLGTSATNSYSYNAKTTIVEGLFTIP